MTPPRSTDKVPASLSGRKEYKALRPTSRDLSREYVKLCCWGSCSATQALQPHFDASSGRESVHTRQQPRGLNGRCSDLQPVPAFQGHHHSLCISIDMLLAGQIPRHLKAQIPPALDPAVEATSQWLGGHLLGSWCCCFSARPCRALFVKDKRTLCVLPPLDACCCDHCVT